jgi:hypothetical protein
MKGNEKQIKKSLFEKLGQLIFRVIAFVFFANIFLSFLSIFYYADTFESSEKTAFSELSYAVQSVSPSGEITTKTFVLQKDIAIDSPDLALNTDLDKESLIFVMGQFEDTDGIEVGEGDFLKYSGTSPKKRLAAKVICKQTNEDLSNALSRLDSSKYDLGSSDSGCAEDGIVCCVIIPIKPTN